uniref:Immunoglobulin superfamily member 10-like n=1 Tax=Sinocyclocheilus anshuiensis TaxID=1608454 RepID=A0A671LIS0_9TELE
KYHILISEWAAVSKSWKMVPSSLNQSMKKIVVTAVPRIQRPNLSYAKVKQGGNVRFDCKAIGEPKPKVFWMLPSKDMIAASNERYLVHANGSLDVRNVKLADAGEYVCMALNAAGEENKVYKLDIDGNPPIINGFNQNRTVMKDTAVKYTRKLIDCKAEGYPVPKITWIMPDNIFLTAPYYGKIRNPSISWTTPGGFVLTIIHDRGNYVCRAKNDAGEAILSVPVVIVAYPPRITNGPPPTVRGVAGVTVYLNCVANGIPTPEITWELPDRSILSTTGKERPVGSELLHTQGTLIIRNPTGVHSGTYKCIAFNYLGRDTKTTYMTVI